MGGREKTKIGQGMHMPRTTWMGMRVDHADDGVTFMPSVRVRSRRRLLDVTCDMWLMMLCFRMGPLRVTSGPLGRPLLLPAPLPIQGRTPPQCQVVHRANIGMMNCQNSYQHMHRQGKHHAKAVPSTNRNTEHQHQHQHHVVSLKYHVIEISWNYHIMT